VLRVTLRCRHSRKSSLPRPSGTSRRTAGWRRSSISELPDGAARELAGEEDPFAGARPYAIRINDEFTVDVLPAAGGVPFGELEPHIVALTVQGETLRVLDLKGLLLTKRGLRPQDQADAALIGRALERTDDRE